MVYVRRTWPHTVHELDCDALAGWSMRRGQPAGELATSRSTNYDKVKPADVAPFLFSVLQDVTP
jgi:hypothetical protein